MKRLVFNPDLCSGCKICMLECELNHGENVINYTKSRIRIRINKEKVIQVAGVCVQCEETPCIDVCPSGALSKDEKLGVIRVDESACMLCGACVNACPYHGIVLNEKLGKILICDLCGGDPACARWCPMEAIKYEEVSGEKAREIREMYEKMAKLWEQAAFL